MEHRIGHRHPTNLRVYVRAASSKLFSRGVLSDVSISGGFIRTSLMAEPLCAVVVQFTGDDSALPPLTAQVVRRTPLGIGVEWAEYATELVQTLTKPTAASTSLPRSVGYG